MLIDYNYGWKNHGSHILIVLSLRMSKNLFGVNVLKHKAVNQYKPLVSWFPFEDVLSCYQCLSVGPHKYISTIDKRWQNKMRNFAKSGNSRFAYHAGH